MDVVSAAAQLTAELQSLGTPARAASERAYLKSDLTHFGTSVPDTRATVKRFVKANPALTHDELIALCRELWSAPVHERRMAVVELLVARQRLLVATDIEWIEQLLRESKTWALVDELARQIVSGMVMADLSLLTTLDRWLGDDDFWVRRSAVLGLSKPLREGRELDRFFRYADELLAEKEFFIRKALGWIARETGRRHPEEVAAWLRRNLDRMNGVTIREAVKYLPDGAALLAAWKAR
ncbi:MAG TPA: DNA alkylation repair protein [Ilumatobacteraceae bacterium]